MKDEKNIKPQLRAIYNNGSSKIIVKSEKGEKEFRVAMYSEADFKKISAAKKLIDKKATKTN